MDALSTTTFTAALAKQSKASTAGVSAADQKKIKKSAQDFEGFFIGQMMQTMTEGLETDSYFGGGHGEEMWRSMLNQEYGKEVAKSGRLGISNTVMTSMLRAQEERTKAQMQAGPLQTNAQSQAAPAADIATATTNAAAIQAGSVLTRSLKGL